MMLVLSRHVYVYRPLRSGALKTELREEEGQVTFIREREEMGGAV
jgi:hypothetical protein